MASVKIEARSIDEIWRSCATVRPVLPPINIGCKSLDSIFKGFFPGEIIEFYGDCATGKTQISLSIIANTLVDDYLSSINDRKIMYIYTHTNPPLDRIRDIIRNRLSAADSLPSVFTLLFRKLLIANPKDYRELAKLLIEDIFEQSSLKDSVGLLVLDSISLLKPIECDESQKGYYALIRSISRHLKKFAHEMNAVIIVTNQAKHFSKINKFTVSTPILGDYWTRTVNTRIYLYQPLKSTSSEYSKSTKRMAKIIYTSKLIPKYENTLEFSIGPLGIQDPTN